MRRLEKFPVNVSTHEPSSPQACGGGKRGNLEGAKVRRTESDAACSDWGEMNTTRFHIGRPLGPEASQISAVLGAVGE